MSSNNQIVIIKKKRKFPQKEIFLIYENPCVDNPISFDKEFLISKEDTLEDAIRKANKYIEENGVEYGLDIII
ncbi:conserved hypothetical protein [Gammaproteobacteria bacterium]